MGIDRPQISKPTQGFSQEQQTSLRSFTGREMIELGRTDCAKQNRISGEAGIKRGRRQRRSCLPDRFTAGSLLFEMKVVAVNVCDFAQKTHGLGGHFRSDSVTRKDYDSQLHGRVRSPRVSKGYSRIDRLSPPETASQFYS